ncbi:MAG TPA: BatA domain-containing protein [Balneolales bacterium]|nr:BatA domain-containing protein [Balneolales bacterium]
MSFLNPFLLIGMAAIAIPVIIHIINLRKPEKLSFSTIAFFEELQKSTIKKIKIKEYLLLATRVLALLFLTLGLARPFLPPQNVPGFAAGKGPVLFTFLVDNSPSMAQIDKNGPYIDQAKQIIKQVTDDANSNDRFLIFNTNGELVNSNVVNKSVVGSIIDNLKVQNKGEFTRSRLKQLLDRSKKNRERRTIFYWLSDGQKKQIENTLTDFNPAKTEAAQNDVPVTLHFVKIGEHASGNVGLTNITIPDKIISYGKQFALIVKVENFSDEPVVNQFISLKINGSLIGQYEVQLEPHQTKKFTFDVPADHEGYIKGAVILEGDPYEFDNKRYFSVKIPAKKSILLVAASRESGEYAQKESYLESALLAAQETSGRISVKKVSLDNLNKQSWKQYDAIILDGLLSIPGYLLNELQSYVQNGHGLILYPSEKGDIQSYNQLLSALNAGKFVGIRGEYGSFNEIAKFKNLVEGHPILNDIFNKKKGESIKVELPKLFYYWVYKESSKTGTDVIFRSNISDPILTETGFGKGKVLISSIGTDPGWSNFPANALYAPINYRVALYASSSEAGGLSKFVLGNTFKWNLPYENKNVVIHLNGEKIKPDVKTGPQGLNITYKADEWSPGWAEISDGTKKNVIAVNQNIMESDFATLHNKNLDKILGEHFKNVSLIESSKLSTEEIKQKIDAAGFGTEIWNWFIWIGLGLLIIETIMTKRLKAESNS